jgi:hypothetical protein
LFLYDFFGEGWIKQTVCDVYKPNAIVRLELSTFNAQVGVFSADNLWISSAPTVALETQTPVKDRRFWGQLASE